MSDIARVLFEQIDNAPNNVCAFGGDWAAEYPLHDRLSVYRDSTHWAMFIERVLYVPQAVHHTGDPHSGIRTWVFEYGNCLRTRRRLGLFRAHVICPTSDPPDGPTFTAPTHVHRVHVRDGASAIMIRGHRAPISTDPATYIEQGIALVDPPRIKPFELVRSMPRGYREMLLATEAELARRIRAGLHLPLILRLDEWCHPVWEKPSESEVFRMIAEVIEKGDPACYRPTKLPNTHWSNWPRAGAGSTETPLDDPQ